jgi:hypothetical protein
MVRQVQQAGLHQLLQALPATQNTQGQTSLERTNDMAIYLDQKRRCDNCLSELGTLVIPCKGAQSYMCHKEICPRCAGEHEGWCDACFEAEVFWYEGEPLGDEDASDLLAWLEARNHAKELRMLDQWNKMAQPA